MNDLIELDKFCAAYSIELELLKSLEHAGLATIVEYEKVLYLKTEELANLERYIRLYRKFNLNIEAIGIINELSETIHLQQDQIKNLEDKLQLYEK